MDNILTFIIFIICGILLIVQGGALYYYIIRAPESFFNGLSKGKERTINIIFNLGVFLGGVGLSIIVLSVKSIIERISKNLAIHIMYGIVLITAFIVSIYVWFLLPGYVGKDSISSEQIKELDLASSTVLALSGFLLGSLIINILKEILNLEIKDLEGPGIGIELIITSVLVLVQSIAGLITYYLGFRSRNFLLIFIPCTIISIGAIILGIFLIAA